MEKILSKSVVGAEFKIFIPYRRKKKNFFRFAVIKYYVLNEIKLSIGFEFQFQNIHIRELDFTARVFT
jgi:hypothetical protein